MDTIRDYAGLLKALDARRKQLGLSHLALDDLAGLPAGYTGKLFTRADKRNARVLGRESFGALVQALGLNLAPIRSAASDKGAAQATQGRVGDAVHERLKKIGAKGGKVRVARMTRRQLIRSVTKASRCRWAKWRAEKRRAEALKARQAQKETTPCQPRPEHSRSVCPT